MITLTAKITLADGTTYDVNKRNMLSLDSKIIDRSDIILPSWGIISNGGNFEIIDYDGRIKVWAESLKLNSKTKVIISLNDTISGASTQVGEFFATKWNYDNDRSTASTTLTDGLQQMHDINIEPLEYDLSQIYTINANKIYDFLQEQTVINGFNMVATSDSDFDSDTLDHLNKIAFSYPYIEEMNLWRAWQYFAEALQLHIFKNRHGKIVCIYREV